MALKILLAVALWLVAAVSSFVLLMKMDSTPTSREDTSMVLAVCLLFAPIMLAVTFIAYFIYLVYKACMFMLECIGC